MLNIVATPIGNLEDITLRALKVLKEADVIVCEDTRVTGKLLSHYEIETKMFSWHANSNSSELDKIIGWLSEGKSIALVTDAGTPTISDPGVLLVQEVRAQLPEVNIAAIPGPSALTAALSISGISSSSFNWLGFLPHKKGRQTIFMRIAESDETFVFYESPHRIEKTLASLAGYAPEKKVTICRELTKMHEEVVSGTASELIKKIESSNLVIKGEFVVIVSN